MKRFASRLQKTMNPFQEFFEGQDVVKYVPGKSGQIVADDGTVLLGDHAGVIGFDNLAHEMAHFVEINDARMQIEGWGLNVPHVVVAGQVCVEPTTMQITAREIRVFAFQANLHRAFGLPFSYAYAARICEWLPDYHYVPLEDGTQAYNENGKNTNLSYNEIQASRNRWRAKKIRRLSRRKAYSLDSFRAEWWKKIEVLRSRRCN